MEIVEILLCGYRCSGRLDRYPSPAINRVLELRRQRVSWNSTSLESARSFSAMSLDHLNGAAFQLKAGMQHENVTRAKQLIEQLTKV